ncbi:uncharacterized protein [Dysidea avara]|uniref:uncharacterized protein isoform X2 n=1 Tax=Dysidea avara TaxID=196820 RepID=UPI003324659A
MLYNIPVNITLFEAFYPNDDVAKYHFNVQFVYRSDGIRSIHLPNYNVILYEKAFKRDHPPEVSVDDVDPVPLDGEVSLVTTAENSKNCVSKVRNVLTWLKHTQKIVLTY